MSKLKYLFFKYYRYKTPQTLFKRLNYNPNTAKMQSDSINRTDLGEETTRGGRPGRLIKPKMDVSKALSLMGFTSARSLDQSGGNDALRELNSALVRRMEHYEKKKRVAIENGKKLPDTQKNPAADKVRDELRTLHEAYQFLSKKYLNHMKTQQGTNSFILDEDDWNIEDDNDYEEAVYENEDELFIQKTDENNDELFVKKTENISIERTRKKSTKKKF